mgnify:CR=1 FL=1
MKMGDRPWFLYVVHCNDGTLYTGVTTDVSRRIREHNTGSRGAKYTQARRPVRLVYCIGFDNRSSAQKAEYKFKKLTRMKKNEVIFESR